MGEKYLIDSNCVIDFCNGKFPVSGRELLFSITEPTISIITYIEVLAFDGVDKKEETQLKDFVSLATILVLNTEISLKTIEIKRKVRIKLPDAVIAATALIHDLTLLTRNIADFKDIPDLKLLNPWFLKKK